MPAPKLVRYAAKTVVASDWTTLVPTVAPNRALVIAKVSIFGRVSSQTGLRWFDGTTERLYNFDQFLNAGEHWTDTGLVVPAGESLQVWCRVANAYDCMAFGEEVDN